MAYDRGETPFFVLPSSFALTHAQQFQLDGIWLFLRDLKIRSKWLGPIPPFRPGIRLDQLKNACLFLRAHQADFACTTRTSLGVDFILNGFDLLKSPQTRRHREWSFGVRGRTVLACDDPAQSPIIAVESGVHI